MEQRSPTKKTLTAFRDILVHTRSYKSTAVPGCYSFRYKLFSIRIPVPDISNIGTAVDPLVLLNLVQAAAAMATAVPWY